MSQANEIMLFWNIISHWLRHIQNDPRTAVWITIIVGRAWMSDCTHNHLIIVNKINSRCNNMGVFFISTGPDNDLVWSHQLQNSVLSYWGLHMCIQIWINQLISNYDIIYSNISVLAFPCIQSKHTSMLKCSIMNWKRCTYLLNFSQQNLTLERLNSA